jgi:hypothetical protein
VVSRLALALALALPLLAARASEEVGDFHSML